jgi:hypothetical protein
MRAVIIDDEVLNIKNLEQLLAKHCPEVEVVGQGQGKEIKQGVAPAKDKSQKPIKTEKANSLLPKKREHTGKGLSV